MDRIAALALRGFAQDQLSWLVPLHVALIAGLAWKVSLQGRGPGRFSGRWRGAVGVILAVGVVVRAVVFPVARHVFDGHEADYYDAWRQLPLSGAMGYRFYSALATVYRGVGSVFDGSPEVLLGLSVVVGVAVIYLAMRLIHALTGEPALALAVGALIALDPAHGFWSSSAYNVMIPLSLSLGALISLERALTRASAASVALAALLWAGATATRLESVLFGLPMAAQLVSNPRAMGRLGVRRIALALAPAAFVGLWHAAAMGLHVPRPEGAESPLDYASTMFALQWSYLGPFGPWGHPVAALVAALGLAASFFSGPRLRRAAGVIVMFIPLHFVFAIFDDYGTRHTLALRLAPALGVAAWLIIAQRGWQRGGIGRWVAPAWAAAVGLVMIGVMAPKLAEGNARYYATPQAFLEQEAAFAEAPYTRPELFASRCVFISESYFYTQWEVASHFEVLDPEARAALRAEYDGCLIFVYDLENYQLSSRAISERADKLRAFFPLKLIGKRLRPHYEDYSLLYRIEERGAGADGSTGVD